MLLIVVQLWAGAAAARAVVPVKHPGQVVLFSGWVIPFFDSTAGTGTEQITKQIQARGVQAEISDPAYWSREADRYMAHADPDAPVAVVGYSFGTNAALLFCEALQSRGLPVETLVLIEANKPVPIPANVRHVVHFYVSGMADPIRPGVGFTGDLRNIDVSKEDPDAARLNHWTFSHFQKLHDAVIDEVLDGDHLRVWTRPAQASSPASTAPKRGRPRALARAPKPEEHLSDRQSVGTVPNL